MQIIPHGVNIAKLSSRGVLLMKMSISEKMRIANCFRANTKEAGHIMQIDEVG